MQLAGLTLTKVPSAVPAWRGTVAPTVLGSTCAAIQEHGGRLSALWGADDRDRGAGFTLHVLFVVEHALLWIDVSLPAENPSFSDLSAVFPCADRMQRAVHDLVGIRHDGGDQRPWLRHAAWPADVFPLRRDVSAGPGWKSGIEDYPFVQVSGDGVHEIPVGPVHAGIIEPGHFRFSVVGEKVLRLEERLGYKHKGIEKRFEGLDFKDGVRLAGRISGDSTVSRDRSSCVPSCSSANGLRITSATSGISATTAASPSDSPSSRDSRKTCCVSTSVSSAIASSWT